MNTPNPHTVPGRVQALLDLRASTEPSPAASREVLVRYDLPDGPVTLTETDLRALVALAGLARTVIVDELYTNLIDGGDGREVLDPSAAARLAEDVANWSQQLRAWMWHPAEALVQRAAADAGPAQSPRAEDGS